MSRRLETAPGPGAAPGATWGLVNVTVRHGRIVLLEHLHLPARQGEITAVVGGDGAGKTTALRTLAGVLQPASGQVSRPPAAQIGHVSAGSGTYLDLTVGENLAFFGAAYGLGRAEIEDRAGPLLARTGLAASREQLAGQLSGGMRQKLALVTAILHRPALLILDEPTTGVDPVSRADLWRLLAGIAAGGAAIVVSTTYLDEAERATTVVVLVDGRPIVSGEPAAIVASMPGALGTSSTRLDPVLSWRRGRGWRTWAPGGVLPAGATPVAPDLEDAVVAAELADQVERSGR